MERGGYNLVGSSKALQKIENDIRLAATCASPVIVTGETGTGKEIVAHKIHLQSDRARALFQTVNCAAIPGDLLESDLFGHERGSFTGAYARKLGKFELAKKGSIFFDEVGELQTKLQAKVLRVLEDGTFYRVGGMEEIRSGARVIAATNRNLQELVQSGGFRDDLFYRLNILHIVVPPLRERPEDVLPVAEHFLRCFSGGKTPKKLSPRTMELLTAHRWPGNVRELRNALERAVITSEKRTEIEPEDLRLNEAPSERNHEAP